MNPEDHPPGSNGFDPRGDQLERLDALLTARQAGRPAGALATRGDLAPLLAAAEMLAPMADAHPSAEFADRLETRLMARVEAREPTHAMTAYPPARHERSERQERHTRRAPPRRRFIQITWAAVAACLMLGMAVGALTASAHPGAPFYSLRKIVEGLNGDQAATARDNLQRARAALAAFNAAASQGNDAGALTALDQLTQADRQAADAIAQVSDSNQQAALQSQLDSLRAEETAGLRAGLANLDWPTRIAVTSALRGLHETALTVTAARIKGATQGDSGDGSKRAPPSGSVTVTVSGGGFIPGAILLLDGRPAGVVDSVTPQTVTAHLPAAALNADVKSIGVGEPDGSAASTTHIESDEHNSDATGTPEPGDHSTPGANTTPGDGSHDGGDGTPTPQGTADVTPTPASLDR
jgi:hypothetical protein